MRRFQGISKKIGLAVLLILLIFVCFGSTFTGSAAIWLHTYNVFTQRTPVAEITISSLNKDDVGPYSDIKVRLVTQDSALAALFGQADPDKQTLSDETSYKVYGDTIYVSGPIVKFKDGLILVNFKTIYKFGKLFGRYDLNNELEINKPVEAQERSSYDINGGYSEWKAVYDHINQDNLLGKIYSSIIDVTQISSAGIFIGGNEQKYTVYMTNLGFIWEKLE